MAGTGAQHFQQELHALEAQALGALDLVVDHARPHDRGARTTRTSSSPSIVIDDDDRIDGRYLEVHQGILSLLALQAPVACDLRTVAALLHVIKHVERMGDQCVNIAKMLPLVRPRAAGRRGDAREDRRAWAARALARSRSPSRRSCCATSTLAEDLVRQDEEINRLNRERLPRARSRSGRTRTGASGR